MVIALDCKGCLIGYNITAVGELSSTTVSPREVMKYEVLSSAAGLSFVRQKSHDNTRFIIQRNTRGDEQKDGRTSNTKRNSRVLKAKL